MLSIKSIAGSDPHAGGELQSVSTPSGARLLTAPAVWHNGATTWLFAADNGGTAAWTFESGKLVAQWKNTNGGTSPVVAGGLLFVYSPQGGLRVYDPEKGNQIADLDSGSGHWNTPIVVDGKIALPEGNANQSGPRAYSTSGACHQRQSHRSRNRFNRPSRLFASLPKTSSKRLGVQSCSCG